MVELRVGAATETVTHEEWEQRVRDDRVPADAQVRIPAVTGDRFVPAGELAGWRALREESARLARRRAGGPPIVTALLVGLQIRLWTWAHVPAVEGVLGEWFVNFSPSVFEDRELWRPLTMGLLQFELLHAFMNLLWSFFLGWLLERTLGRAQLLVVFVTSVLTGSLLSTLASPWTPSLGSSGGVFGLVGAVVTFGIVRAELVESRLVAFAGVGMLPYLVLTFWSGLGSEGVDNWCHLGGMLSGLLLGLVLDPPHGERRPGWNRTVWASLLLAQGLVWGAIGAAGPSLVPLWDSVEAQAAVRRREARAPAAVAPPETPPALRFSVPGGWRSGRDSAGHTAFLSPVGPRAFGVRADPRDRPVAAEDVLAELRTAVLADWPSATFEAPEPTTLAGRDGLRQRGTTGGGDPRVIEHVVVTRGVWTLAATWEVDAGRRERLEPLRERLLASVAWDDPEELVRARAEHAARPTRASTVTLAAALAAVGERDEARRLHDELLRSPDADAWRACLADELVLGASAAEVAALVERLLASDPDPKSIVAAADALESAGDAELARGLIAVAWERSPGDRALRRARRARRLSTVLLPDGRPWDRVYDPGTRAARGAAAEDERTRWALDLATARLVARRGAEERAAAARALEDALSDGSPSVSGWLSVLAQGDDTAAGSDLQLLFDEALAEPPPGWLPAEAAARVRASAGQLRALRPPDPPPDAP